MSRLRRGTLALTAAGIITVGMVGAYEGLRLKSYQDVIGVWTVCYGETKGIKRGMQFTKPECDAMLASRLVEFETGMRKCLKSPDTVPIKPYITFVSFSYNVGTGAFCKSTLAKKVNAGDIAGACRELPKWNKAGGRTIRGLTIRRQKEMAYCLEGAR